MRAAVMVGVLLIVFGLVSLIYQGITYTKQEEVFEIGPIRATAETEKTIPLHPIVGGLAVVTGTVLVVAASKKRQ
jgi:hypothetical protein